MVLPVLVESSVMDEECELLTYKFWILAARREALKTQMVEMEIGSLNPAIVQRPLDATPAQPVSDGLGTRWLCCWCHKPRHQGLRAPEERKKPSKRGCYLATWWSSLCVCLEDL